MADERPRPTGALRISKGGAAKIGLRGYTIDDARAVLERNPLWRWQPSRDYVDESGRLRVRPSRWRLIGRGSGGEVLCVIIELPDDVGDSQVVTIFEASPRYRSEYADWAGRSA